MIPPTAIAEGSRSHEAPVVLAFGGGVNSEAAAIELVRFAWSLGAPGPDKHFSSPCNRLDGGRGVEAEAAT